MLTFPRYNNDHLVHFCANHFDILSQSPSDKRLTGRLQQFFQRPCAAGMVSAGWGVFVYNNKRHDPAVSFKDEGGLPPNLIAVHHVNKTGMVSLNRLEWRTRHASHGKNRSAAAAFIGRCEVQSRPCIPVGACTSTITQGNFMLNPHGRPKKSVRRTG